MEPGTLILVVGAVLLAAVAAAAVAGRAGVPVLVAFLGLGMLLGSDGLGGIEFDDAHLARTVGIVGLAIILFEGGISTPWRAVRPVVVPAALLSTVGVVVTAAITGFVAHLVFPLSWSAALLLGAVVASTDAAAVFSTLRVTNLRRRLARVLEVESGANDPVAVALTIGLIQWVADRSYGAEDLVLLVARQLSLGLVLGVVVGGAAAWTLARLPGLAVQFAPVATVAAGAIGFGLADVAGGSGFLAVYIVGLWVGNASTPLRRYLVSFHAGLAFLAQVGLFIVLGLFVFPRELGPVILPGLALVAVLLFVARPIAVWIATIFQGFEPRERALLGWAGLRGAVPIVLATYPRAAGLPQSATIFNAVFFVVIASALIQGTTLEPFARFLELTGRRVSSAPPLEVAAVDSLGSGLLEFGVAPDSTVVGTHVRDLGLPRDALVAVIVRDDEAVPPRGSTQIESGDTLYVLSRKESRRAIERLFAGWRRR
jgi:cell volume regulation protein A